MRGGSLLNQQQDTIMVGSGGFCVAFVVLFGGARMSGRVQ
jgi:hypothetical protein